MIYMITFGILILCFGLSAYRQHIMNSDEKKSQTLKWIIVGLLVLDLLIAVIC